MITKMPVAVRSGKVEMKQNRRILNNYFIKDGIIERNNGLISSSHVTSNHGKRPYGQVNSDVKGDEINPSKTQLLSSNKKIPQSNTDGARRERNNGVNSGIRKVPYRKHRSKHSLRKTEIHNGEFEETNMEHFKTDEEWQPEEDWLVENLIVAPIKSSKSTSKRKNR